MQALKKAKQFAIRKLCRRLVESRLEKGDQAGKSDARLSSDQAVKIEAQLATVKVADICQLAREVVGKELGGCTQRIDEEHNELASADDVSNSCQLSNDEVIRRQLCGAACVRSAVLEAKALLQLIEKESRDVENKKWKKKRGRIEGEQKEGAQTNNNPDVVQLCEGKKQRPGAPGKMADVAGGAKEGKVVKNRLGQHARRLAAEVKYGREAKHLAQLAQQQHDHAQTQNADKEEQTFKPKPNFTKDHQSERKYVARPQPAKVEEENLHPSWVAKKQQRCLIASAASVKPSKIVFGDDEASYLGGEAVGMPLSKKLKKEPVVRPSYEKESRQVTKRAVFDPPQTGHPSWDAKQKEKQRLASLSQVKGKKMVFSDD